MKYRIAIDKINKLKILFKKYKLCRCYKYNSSDDWDEYTLDMSFEYWDIESATYKVGSGISIEEESYSYNGDYYIKRLNILIDEIEKNIKLLKTLNFKAEQVKMVVSLLTNRTWIVSGNVDLGFIFDEYYINVVDDDLDIIPFDDAPMISIKELYKLLLTSKNKSKLYLKPDSLHLLTSYPDMYWYQIEPDSNVILEFYNGKINISEKPKLKNSTETNKIVNKKLYYFIIIYIILTIFLLWISH